MNEEIQDTQSPLEAVEWFDYRFSLTLIDDEHVFVCLDETAFCDEYYGQPFKARQHFMKRICKKAEVKPFSFHCIRHLSATVQYHSGKKLNYLQRFLRHQNPSTTERYLKSLGLEKLHEGLEDGFKRPDVKNPEPPPSGNNGGGLCEVIQFPNIKSPEAATSEETSRVSMRVSGHSEQ